MIRTVTVTNERGESLLIDLFNPASSGFEVHDISGLGPPKGTINFAKISTMDGVIYNSATAVGKNILLTLGFLDIPSVEEIRHKSYQYFPIKKKVELVFKSDKRTLGISGRVESNEPNIFSQEKNTVISIQCEDAYFIGLGEQDKISTDFYSTVGGFEFPFSNESLTEPLIEFAQVISILEKNIYYYGDADVGITLKVSALGVVENPRIYNADTGESIFIDTDVLEQMTGSGLVSGDTMIIKTSKGEKSAYLTRNGVTTNVLNALGKNVRWLQLSKGNNKLAYTADAGVGNLQLVVESRVLYEGA